MDHTHILPLLFPSLCTLSLAFDTQWYIHCSRRSTELTPGGSLCTAVSSPDLARVCLLFGPYQAWYAVGSQSVGAGPGVLAHTLESVLVGVTNACHREAEGGATGAVKKEGGVVWEGGACLVHEDINRTPYFLFPLKVIGGTHQEVLPPAKERRRGDGTRSITVI